jgi:hypothetical protein
MQCFGSQREASELGYRDLNTPGDNSNYLLRCGGAPVHGIKCTA